MKNPASYLSDRQLLIATIACAVIGLINGALLLIFKSDMISFLNNIAK